MRAVRLIRKYFRCWEEAIRMLNNSWILTPFLLAALIQSALLLAIANFPRPPFSYIMVGLIKGLAGERGLHYPTFYLLLPDTFKVLSLPVLVVFSFVLYGWGVFMMIDYYQGQQQPFLYYKAEVLWNAFCFMQIGLLFAAFVVAAPLLISRAGNLMGDPLAKMLIKRSSKLVGFLFEVALAYALFFSKFYREKPLSAVAKSVSFARKRFLLTAMIIITLFIIHKPADYLLDNSSALIFKLSPDWVPAVMVADIAVGIFTNYFLFAATTYLAMHRRRVWG